MDYLLFCVCISYLSCCIELWWFASYSLFQYILIITLLLIFLDLVHAFYCELISSIIKDIKVRRLPSKHNKPARNIHCSRSNLKNENNLEKRFMKVKTIHHIKQPINCLPIDWLARSTFVSQDSIKCKTTPLKNHENIHNKVLGIYQTLDLSPPKEPSSDAKSEFLKTEGGVNKSTCSSQKTLGHPKLRFGRKISAEFSCLDDSQNGLSSPLFDSPEASPHTYFYTDLALSNDIVELNLRALEVRNKPVHLFENELSKHSDSGWNFNSQDSAKTL